MSARQVVLIGCNYAAADGSQVRRERYDVADDMPEAVVATLTADGAVISEAEYDALAASANGVIASDNAAAASLAEDAQDKPRRTRAVKVKE